MESTPEVNEEKSGDLPDSQGEEVHDFDEVQREVE